MNKVLWASGKDDWETPGALFELLDREHHFTLDAAANPQNHKTPRWYGPGGEIEDALAVEWPTTDRIWLNPPYSRGLAARFIAKAADTGRRGGYVVALLPARTDTRAFHDHIWDGDRPYGSRPGVCVVFLRGRLRFVGAAHSAPFPSMLVRFRLDR